MSTLEQKYESLLQAVAALQKEIDRLKQENVVMLAEKVQWQAQKAQQDAIIQKALMNSNQTNNAYLEENRRLQEELKRLKGN